ncbi:energy transducer TonB [Thalassomonas actiniarum]|uniref:Energy transducer TonB n=1 Tax=Thalassomonas actiniarum TaxID=485447 RepID=A0AAE9YW71_9GAMM|nr:energy transducer TonB [Thalassomonas actiniarum]WDE01490.1 energy transducer TonB [Thalassomonas actiniarum]
MNQWLLLILFTLILQGCQSTRNNPLNEPDSIVYAIENREDIRPVILIKPKYPIAAANQGIEGSCKVTFDLGKVGILTRAVNIEITECMPQGIFEKVCIDSIKRWAFRDMENLDTHESPYGLITYCKFELN